MKYGDYMFWEWIEAKVKDKIAEKGRGKDTGFLNRKETDRNQRNINGDERYDCM